MMRSSHVHPAHLVAPNDLRRCRRAQPRRTDQARPSSCRGGTRLWLSPPRRARDAGRTSDDAGGHQPTAQAFDIALPMLRDGDDGVVSRRGEGPGYPPAQRDVGHRRLPAGRQHIPSIAPRPWLPVRGEALHRQRGCHKVSGKVETAIGRGTAGVPVRFPDMPLRHSRMDQSCRPQIKRT